MSSTEKVTVDYCSVEAARYGCENWHYSQKLPAGKNLYIGAWEKENFKGCIVYGDSASPELYSPYGLNQRDGCELRRVAFRNHDKPISFYLSKSRQLLTEKCPDLKIIISFADQNQDHLGKIYQPDNWYYLGETGKQTKYKVNGKKTHSRVLSHRYGTTKFEWIKENVDPNAEKVQEPGKHRYAYPLTKPIRYKLKNIKKSYPH